MVAQRQQPIVINVMVGEDRRLIVDLPPDTPTGNYTVTLIWHPVDNDRMNAGQMPAGTLSSEETLREPRSDE